MRSLMKSEESQALCNKGKKKLEEKSTFLYLYNNIIYIGHEFRQNKKKQVNINFGCFFFSFSFEAIRNRNF